MLKPVSSQHRKPYLSIKNFVIIATKLSNLIKLYQLACLNMLARHIYPAILPASPDCAPQMVWPSCIQLVSAAHPAAAKDRSINISPWRVFAGARTSNSHRQPARLENSGYRNYERSLRRNARTLAPRIFFKYCHGTPSL